MVSTGLVLLTATTDRQTGDQHNLASHSNQPESRFKLTHYIAQNRDAYSRTGNSNLLLTIQSYTGRPKYKTPNKIIRPFQLNSLTKFTRSLIESLLWPMCFTDLMSITRKKYSVYPFACSNMHTYKHINRPLSLYFTTKAVKCRRRYAREIRVRELR